MSAKLKQAKAGQRGGLSDSSTHKSVIAYLPSMNYLTGEKQDLWLQQAFPYNRSTVVEGDKESRMGSTVDSKRVVRRAGAFSKAAADYFVESLPGIGNLAAHPTHPLTLHAGNIPSYPGDGAGGADGPTGKDAEIFFMMVNSRRSAGKERVIFWFNGGPGCSSFDGSLMEVGPFRTKPALQTESGKVELELVEGGWEEFATIVFVDQPPGTGYSTVPTNGYLHELSQASAHLLKFMENFYTIFPEMKSKATYLAGESFAGQYIPYFADALLNAPAFFEFPLQGIAIGNGWIDPKEQYQGYVDFAYEKGLIKQGSKEAETLEQYMQQCQTQLDKYVDPADVPINVDQCGQVMGAVTDPFIQDLNGNKVCMNVYDVRLSDEYPACGMNWPPDLTDIYQYLRRPDVVKALHASDKETAWVECDNIVSSQLYLRNSPASVSLIPGILERGVKVMMFAGDEDLICNYKGIERLIGRLQWSGGQGLADQSSEDWYVNGTYAGTWQTGRNLTYVRVAGGSHMVGYDLPEVTNDMITRFMDVDMSMVVGDIASIPSRLGDKERPQLGSISGVLALPSAGKSPLGELDAWYHAGSAIVVLGFLISAAGLYFFLRARNRFAKSRISLEPRPLQDEEERVPLGQGEAHEMGDYQPRPESFDNGSNKTNSGNGFGRNDYDDGQVVFELGDDDDEHNGQRAEHSHHT